MSDYSLSPSACVELGYEDGVWTAALTTHVLAAEGPDVPTALRRLASEIEMGREAAPREPSALWIDPDDAPEWPDDVFDRARLSAGNVVIREETGTLTRGSDDVVAPGMILDEARTRTGEAA